MINLFSIYKKALLIPRSGLDELPDTTLFGLLIYWNDLQLSSHAFPEHNRNQLSMNEVRETGAVLQLLGSQASTESQPARNGVRRDDALDGHCCCFECGKRKRADCVLCSHRKMQGHNARPSSCSPQLPWGAHGYRQPCL